MLNPYSRLIQSPVEITLPYISTMLICLFNSNLVHPKENQLVLYFSDKARDTCTLSVVLFGSVVCVGTEQRPANCAHAEEGAEMTSTVDNTMTVVWITTAVAKTFWSQGRKQGQKNIPPLVIIDVVEITKKWKKWQTEEPHLRSSIFVLGLFSPQTNFYFDLSQWQVDLIKRFREIKEIIWLCFQTFMRICRD